MTWTRLLRAWLIILPFMIANGILRELVLARLFDRAIADALSAVIGIAIIIVSTRYLLHPLAGKSVPQLVRASALLVALTVVFEFAFGHYVDKKSWAELAANYEIWNGRLWPLVLAVLATTPFVWGRWSLEDTHHVRR